MVTDFALSQNATLQKQDKAQQTEKEGANEEQKDPEVMKAWNFFDTQCNSRVAQEIDFDHFDPSSLAHPIIFEGTLPAGSTNCKEGIQIKGKLKVTALVERAPLTKECKDAKEKFQR